MATGMILPMRTFPIMLNLAGRPVVVVGCGEVGLRKAESLLAVGATVTLVDPNAPADVVAALRGKTSQSPVFRPAAVTILRLPYSHEMLAGAFLVFACTDDRELNSRIAADARTAGALVNAVDQPDDCDFFMPSTIRRGDVVLALGTGGAAPALAAWLSRELEGALPGELADFAAALAQLRTRLKEAVPDSRRRMAIMKALCSRKAYDAFAAGGATALDTMLSELMPKR
jgi:precorrin-2 dehydrogenase/sirohydrochlorin ferrochelatase